MIKEKEVEINIERRNVTKYRELGYNCCVGDIIKIKTEELSPNSRIRLTAICDWCGIEIPNVRYVNYITACRETGSYCCTKCGIEKRKQRNLEKYGVENTTQLPETVEKIHQTCINKYGVNWVTDIPNVREKINNTFLEHYGVPWSLSSPKIQQQIHETNIQKYGYPYATQSPEIKEKTKQTNLERYGYACTASVPEIKQKQRETLFKNNTCPCSLQQQYLYNLFGGELNYPFKEYSLDIAFPKINTCVEFNGSGHDLNVKHNTITQEEFDRKQLIRFYILKRAGWKQIIITSPHDKLPPDYVLLHMLSISRQYFGKYPNHSWIEWLIDENKYRTAETPDGVFFDYGQLKTIRAA